jgi:hypothetical protein
MDKWIHERLAACLCFDVPQEMIEYIQTINDEEALKSYFESLLDFNDETHCIFFSSLKQKLFPSQHIVRLVNQKKNQQSTAVPPVKGGNKKKIQQDDEGEDQSSRTGTKKKTKFYNFYGSDGQANDSVLLKGRNRCECQATKHKLINNCLNCGRIVCEQEGSGACFFCGQLVCSEDELKLIQSQSKKGDNLKKSLMEQKRPKGLEDAIAQRDRLLEFDRQSERRTTVIDDESDYFKANSVWLSDEERKKLMVLENQLRDTKHSSRMSRKVTLDFAGRQVIEQEPLSEEIEQEILRKIIDATTTTTLSDGKFPSGDVHPDLAGQAPVFDESIQSAFPKLKSSSGFDGVYSRVQDKEFQEMSDMKRCMSMHQPWASLLIAGIKRHEGRSWYTAHRGRLWIASTAKPVDPEEVKRMEQFYRIHFKKDENSLKFPSQYPSGVLLGCVEVTDCLPQEEYRKVHQGGESESPFVFICNDPQELPVRFPIKGMHKICKFSLAFPFNFVLFYFILFYFFN